QPGCRDGNRHLQRLIDRLGGGGVFRSLRCPTTCQFDLRLGQRRRGDTGRSITDRQTLQRDIDRVEGVRIGADLVVDRGNPQQGVGLPAHVLRLLELEQRTLRVAQALGDVAALDRKVAQQSLYATTHYGNVRAVNRIPAFVGDIETGAF